jgi:hypothetical protein
MNNIENATSNSSFFVVLMQLLHRPQREHHFPISPLMCVRNLLPSSLCLQSHYLTTGLHASKCFSLHSHVCYMPCQSSRFDFIKILVKLIVMSFSPTSCYFLPLRTKYSPQHSVLKHPHSVLFFAAFTIFV